MMPERRHARTAPSAGLAHRPPWTVRAVVRGLLVAPLLYSLAIPLVLLDLWVSMYQWCVFPPLGIATVRRSPYVRHDRYRLPYLDPLTKVHCTYCSYATGLLAYVREVTARTEEYWCPIRHGRAGVDPHEHYEHFLAYGDAAAYADHLEAIRRRLVHADHAVGDQAPSRQARTRPATTSTAPAASTRHQSAGTDAV